MPNVVLHLGDALAYMRGMDAGAVDCVLTDPPYNANLNYATYKDDLPQDEYWKWLVQVVNECNRVARMVVIKHSALKVYDWTKHINRSRLIIWYKPFSSGFRVNGFATHFEPLWVTKGETVAWSRDVLVQNSGACNREASTGHPAQMPQGLALQLVDVCTLPGQTILDPFMGSGTIGVAAVQAGRRFLGVEIDPGYFAIAQRRIAAAQDQPRLLDYTPHSQPQQAYLLDAAPRGAHERGNV